MGKVISLIKSFKTILYFEIFEFGKTGFDSNQFRTDLNYFEFYLNCSRAHLPFSHHPSYSWAPLCGPTHRPAHLLSLFSLFPCLSCARPGAVVPELPLPDHTPLVSGAPSSSAPWPGPPPPPLGRALIRPPPHSPPL
jgi:hypothetical protein